jgi:Flp pilus assembly pilin Flp
VHCEYQLFLAGVTESVVVAVFEEVVGGIAGVWNGVGVAIESSARSNLARVAYAVAVTVGLRWVSDCRAVVQGVDSAVAVGVDTCECYGVEHAPRDL